MNNNLKVLIGAAIGGGIGYFVANVVIEIIYLREQTDTPEELDTIDDGYGSVTEDEFSDKETFQRPTKMSTKEKNYTKHFIANERPELKELVRKYNTGELGEEPRILDAEEVNGPIADLEEFETPEEDPDVPTDPSIISRAEYSGNTEGLACITLHYFDDDVVTDEQDIPIDRPERILGDEALFSFGVESEDEDVVYVRNRAKKCLYEVIRLNKEYGASPATRSATREALRRKRMRKEAEDAEDTSA